mmetsp:Transcript_43750/g.115587  ORF Transcript_43750/g.115587 Transcript_43750/m.115587 type:complete len:231 (+) Transcript_43750:219-911(+)
MRFGTVRGSLQKLHTNQKLSVPTLETQDGQYLSESTRLPNPPQTMVVTYAALWPSHVEAARVPHNPVSTFVPMDQHELQPLCAVVSTVRRTTQYRFRRWLMTGHPHPSGTHAGCCAQLQRERQAPYPDAETTQARSSPHRKPAHLALADPGQRPLSPPRQHHTHHPRDADSSVVERLPWKTQESGQAIGRQSPRQQPQSNHSRPVPHQIAAREHAPGPRMQDVTSKPGQK